MSRKHGSRSRCGWIFVALVACGACTTSPPGGTPTPTPTPTPNGSDDTFRLTLNLRSGNGAARGMNVHVMVDDRTYTRANAPYSDSTIAVGNFTNSVDPDTFAVDVLAGETITLIATESPGSFASAFGQPDPENFIDPFHVEWLTWEGDDDTRPEAGVTTILMNADKTVTAVYARMPRVLMRKFNENNPQLSGGCFDVAIDPTPRLGLPGDTDLAEAIEDPCCCNADQGDIFLFGQVKTGTQVTFTATDFNGCDIVSGTCTEAFLEWRGSAAALCGSSRECMLTIGEDVDASGVWMDNSP